MSPDVVVDIGNSRIKWGICRENQVVEVIRLPLDDSGAWEGALEAISKAPTRWAISSVNAAALQRFQGWTKNRGETGLLLHYKNLPIRMNVQEPERVGLDRLFGAIAARAMAPERPAITVDIGTACTVNLIDVEGIFQGGAILPGPTLMSKALHDYTAKLPLIEIANLHSVSPPGRSTNQAIELGIQSAVGGALDRLIRYFSDIVEAPPVVFLTGGDVGPFEDIDDNSWTPDPEDTRFAPTLVLEGIRIAAESLP